MKSLTVCITSFKRPNYLKRAIDSCLKAGVENIVVFSMCPDAGVWSLAMEYSDKIKFHSLPVDLGCNELWAQTAYHANTKHILLLHDDDFLAPEFGKVYRETIKPQLHGGVGFASWRGHAYHNDGRIRQLEYRNGPTQVLPSAQIEMMVSKKGRLSLSPIVSVFDRRVLIQACKESHEVLPWLHEGMILGTEILVYLRHCSTFRSWLYVDKVLSYYGSHEGSGTCIAEASGDLSPLVRGYDATRDHFTLNRVRPPFPLAPRCLLLSTPFEAKGDEAVRIANARKTWDFQFNLGKMLDFPVTPDLVPRSSGDIGDPRKILFLKDLMNYGAAHAMPEDILVYANLDVAFTINLPQRIRDCVHNSGGVCCAWRRTMKFDPNQMFETVRNGRLDGGVDVIACTPDWWQKNSQRLPDMYVSATHWDYAFRVYCEQHTQNKCYINDGVYHYPHEGLYDRIKHLTPAQQHNRDEAKKFFTATGRPKLAASIP